MKKKYLLTVLFSALIVVIYSCSKNDNEEVYVPVSPVVVDLSQVPYPKLSDYHFFEGDMKNQVPSLNVIPYEPASTLFTDYASKKRFIWMPNGVKGTYVADDKIIDFPVGTVLIKTFYYTTIQPDNTTKIIETRLMIRKSDGWHFYEYLWNEAQTDADLVQGEAFSNGSSVNITFKKPNNEIINTNYRIPSDSECLACHKSNEIPTPIGIKPQNINVNYLFADGSKNQLQKLVEQGYLNSYPSNIVSTVNYKDATQPLDLRVRSYLDINCAHCHIDNGRCDYRMVRFAFSETTDPNNIGICVNADEEISPTLQKIVTPGIFSKSVLHYRLETSDESLMMPLIGRTIVHDEGVQLLEEWIASLTQTCD